VYNKMSFLLLSKDLGEFVRRFDYLRHYSSNRKKQADLIFKTRQDLMTQEQKVVYKKKEEKKVLVEKEGEKKKLEVLKTKEDKVVTVLTQQEKKLKTELERKKLAVRKLPKEDKKTVVAETKKAKVEPAPAPVEEKKIESNTYYMNADEAKLASSFAALRGRMPFPVPSGFISDHFGVHKHPLLKGVMINNNGIDIQTSPGSPVHSVYDGVVQSVVNIPGINMVVAIQHGDYFTVYSKLANVSVSVGTRVRTGQRIGSVASDDDGTAEINFQVWKNTVRQNPESWLRR